MSKKNNLPFVLLVEGNNDFHIVCSLCQHYGVKENFNIIPHVGVNEAITEFQICLKNPSAYRKIGIIVDADNNIDGRWQQLMSILKKGGKYDCDNPGLPSSGLILQPKDEFDSTVGVWVMPDNTNKGMIEDFALNMIEPTDPLLEKAETTLREIEQDGLQRYKDVHRSKAKIHTYLAWQDEPGKPIGQSITTKILNAESNTAKMFTDWLKRLFDVGSV